MPTDPIQAYCHQVTLMIRCRSACPGITAELTAHMEDHADALAARGVPPEEARRQAAAAMGDPRALGAELDRVHNPWYPRLSRLFCLLALVLVLAGLYITDGEYAFRYAPWSSPAALAARESGLYETTVLAVGKATGGGRLGAYAFSNTAHAALVRIDPDASAASTAASRYEIRVVFTSLTPCFWLGPMSFYATPAVFHTGSGEEVKADFTPRPTVEQGLFRGFYSVSLPVADLAERHYTLEFGGRHELIYFLTLEEADAP